MRLARLIPLLAAAVLAASCGGNGSEAEPNGVAELEVGGILDAAVEAVGDATSVRIQTTSGDGSYEYDLHLVPGKGGVGEMTTENISFELMRIGDKAYFKGGLDFWQTIGGTPNAESLQDRWVEVPLSHPQLSGFLPLTEFEEGFRQILENPGPVEKRDETTVDGEPAIAIVSTTGNGTLYIATTGEPYPLQIQGEGASPGQITFSEWNEPVELEAPEDAVELPPLPTGTG